MKRLFIDQNYTPPVIRLITALHELEFPKTYEVVSGKWLDEYAPADTTLFLIDTNKKGLNALTLDQFAYGYKIIAYRKPEGKPFDPFKCSMALLSKWPQILSDIGDVKQGKLLATVSSGLRPSYTLIEKSPLLPE